MFKRIKQWGATRILRRGGTSQQREEAVGVLQKELALEPLVAALQDKNREVRKAVAEALGQIGDARVVEPLVAALQNKNQEVREDVGRALVRIGKPAVEPLVAALQDKKWEVRWMAAQALGQIGDARVVEPLVAALQNKKWEVRWMAAQALGQIGDARAVEPLLVVLMPYRILCNGVVVLQDKKWEVRWMAAQALGQIGDARAVEPLLVVALQAMSHVVNFFGGPNRPNQEVLKAVGQALVRIGKPAVEPLVVALQSSDWRVQKAAAEALGQIRDPRAVEPLVRFLQDEDRLVQAATAQLQLVSADWGVQVGEAAIVALKKMLEHAAADIPLADLGAVVHLNTVVKVRIVLNSCGYFSAYVREPVDTSHVRQLARQELIRRGLQRWSERLS